MRLGHVHFRHVGWELQVGESLKVVFRLDSDVKVWVVFHGVAHIKVVLLLGRDHEMPRRVGLAAERVEALDSAVACAVHALARGAVGHWQAVLGVGVVDAGRVFVGARAVALHRERSLGLIGRAHEPVGLRCRGHAEREPERQQTQALLHAR